MLPASSTTNTTFETSLPDHSAPLPSLDSLFEITGQFAGETDYLSLSLSSWGEETLTSYGTDLEIAQKAVLWIEENEKEILRPAAEKGHLFAGALLKWAGKEVSFEEASKADRTKDISDLIKLRVQAETMRKSLNLQEDRKKQAKEFLEKIQKDDEKHDAAVSTLRLKTASLGKELLEINDQLEIVGPTREALIHDLKNVQERFTAAKKEHEKALEALAIERRRNESNKRNTLGLF